MYQKKILLTALLLSLLILPAFAADEEPGRPEYTILRRTEKIVIDGVLDDPDWAACESLGPLKFPWYNYEKRPAVQKAELEFTHVKLLWDDEFLYITYQCDDKHIWADHYDSHSHTYKDDCVEFFWNPAPDTGNAYNMFEINCIGNMLACYNNFDRSTRLTDRLILPPHVAQTVRGSVNWDGDIDGGWTIELALRFEDYPELMDEPPRDGTLWRAGINRCGGMTNWQDSMWAPEFGKTVGNFHLYQYFGKLWFRDEPVR